MKSIPKQLEKLVFGQRESSRGCTILTHPILIIWGGLRSCNHGALAQSKNQFFKLFGYRFSLFLMLLYGVSGYAASVNILNDSPYTLTAQVVAADGNTLGRLIIAAGHMQTWQDHTSGTYAFSQTPYTVIFSCPTGKQYGVFANVQQGATITALTSVGDRYCEPPKQQQKQREEKIKQWEARHKQLQNQSGPDLETDSEWSPP